MSLTSMGSVWNECRGQLPEGLVGWAMGKALDLQTGDTGKAQCSSGAVENLREAGAEVGSPLRACYS